MSQSKLMLFIWVIFTTLQTGDMIHLKHLFSFFFVQISRINIFFKSLHLYFSSIYESNQSHMISPSGGCTVDSIKKQTYSDNT